MYSRTPTIIIFYIICPEPKKILRSRERIGLILRTHNSRCLVGVDSIDYLPGANRWAVNSYCALSGAYMLPLLQHAIGAACSCASLLA